MSFLAPVLDNYRKTLDALGLDADELFAEIGIDAGASMRDGRVDYEQVDRLRALAAERARAPDFGIHVARHLQAAHLGTMGLAWLNSRTLRDALERFQRFGRLFNDHVEVDLSEKDGCLVYALAVSVPSANDAVRFDSGLATSLALCRMTADESLDPVRATFVHEAPAEPGPWYAYFRCPVEFGSEANALWFDRADVDRLLPTANPHLATVLDREIVAYLARIDRDDVVNRTRHAIIEQLPSGAVSEASVAESLHLTPRTLHRRLADHDTGFRQLLNEVRSELAVRYVADPGLTLTEVSFLLGFSEASAFSRAFRRWTGQAPSEARQDVAG